MPMSPAYRELMTKLCERNRTMRRLRAQGWSDIQIAKRFKISRQRVYAILKAMT